MFLTKICHFPLALFCRRLTKTTNSVIGLVLAYSPAETMQANTITNLSKVSRMFGWRVSTFSSASEKRILRIKILRLRFVAVLCCLVIGVGARNILSPRIISFYVCRNLYDLWEVRRGHILGCMVFHTWLSVHRLRESKNRLTFSLFRDIY